ncbi:HAD family hydrolase [Luteimicrobium subarcticum]|uniref:HAD superfamily hydrolase (TIGR01509 family)/HAD superfamily hydrolase (TIGR01549 family) n=1 Tax=Luteimicrobium subarcticum TaxID=620910 RepID=A0A2M8W1T7_9MICO|nr:HAD family hydrolase [Luteimicrobium subarcticum]PJI84868.1 HAD superfamily hydrolase (TIGR01509 family)/HAD superfamily hydrolase (TIGR01549 family) [Luteimicrobium subarcticum]
MTTRGDEPGDLPVAGGVLFDVDGTLVDSNYLQVDAWVRAFHDVGLEVDAWTVHRTLGQAGPELIERVGGSAAAAWTARLSDAHERYSAASAFLLRRTPGARELVRAVAAHGVRPVLATSASPASLERLRAVLDVDDAIRAVTSADDVDVSKPEPDLVHRALEAGVIDPARAVFVGDSVWDVEAAGRAGIPCVGVLCGGVAEAELREAGAVAVYRDPQDLLDRLDDSPLTRAFSP